MFGLVQKGIVVGVNSQGFNGQPGEVIELPEIRPGQLWDGFTLSDPVLSFQEFENALTEKYVAAMTKALNGYSLIETTTWSEKSEASKARIAGTDDALDRITLAKIGGVINGSVYTTPERVNELDQGLSPDDLAVVDATAAKILEARIRFSNLSGEIERLRDKRWRAGKNSADYTTEIAGLVEDYAALETSYG